MGAGLLRGRVTRRLTVALGVGAIRHVRDSALVGIGCCYEVDAEWVGSENRLVHKQAKLSRQLQKGTSHGFGSTCGLGVS